MLNRYATWVPYLFSAGALGVSIYGLWRTHLAGAKLEILPTNRIAFTRNPHVVGAIAPAIIVSFVTYNAGANMGYIDDVAVYVRRRGSSEAVLFRSLYEELTTKLDFSKSLPPPEWRAFTTFVIPGRQSVFKTVFLIIEGSTTFYVTPGEYDLTIKTISGSSKWRSWPVQSVTINEHDVQAMEPKVTLTGEGEHFVALKHVSKPTDQSMRAIKELTKQLGLPAPVIGPPLELSKNIDVAPSSGSQGLTFSISTGSTGSASSNPKTRE